LCLGGDGVFAGERSTEEGEVVKGNTAFALDLYGKLREQAGNLFCSPYSISTALAMTFNGARGNTEAEMARVLHFTLSQDKLHPAMGKLMTDLNNRKVDPRRRRDPSSPKKPFELVVANALWGQKGYPFHRAFLDGTKANYEAGLTSLDIQKDPEKARKTINAWVEKKTNKKIKDLIPPGSITPLVRLVLTNAIYFKSAWTHPFKERFTRKVPFHLSPESPVDVPTMHLTEDFRYLDGETFQALELPYKHNVLSMVILLPKKHEGMAALEKSLTVDNLQNWRSRMRFANVRIALPKFKFTSMFILNDALMAMGMKDAFNGKTADFSGMADTKELFIGFVIHKAFVDVNEEGTEAAAATAVGMLGKGMPSKTEAFKADRPFLFLIRDNVTGSVLFLGRVSDPRG
jgi:serpin B